MKAINILICILFASLLILSPAITARELADQNKGYNIGGRAEDPKRAIISCGNRDTPSYNECIEKLKPKPTKCKNDPIYNRHGCEPPK